MQHEQSTRVSKSPSFKDFLPASLESSKQKSKLKRKDTKCELLLRSVLWRRGFRFRKNVRSLPGAPDIVFARSKVVVFCDGDFWHGRKWAARQASLGRGHNAEYWIKKIEANIARDLRHTQALQDLGWTVFRLWETDILKDVEAAADSVVAKIEAALLTQTGHIDPAR
jgi:DNA mismatch endonuclease (patch repair protein)